MGTVEAAWLRLVRRHQGGEHGLRRWPRQPWPIQLPPQAACLYVRTHARTLLPLPPAQGGAAAIASGSDGGWALPIGALVLSLRHLGLGGYAPQVGARGQGSRVGPDVALARRCTAPEHGAPALRGVSAEEPNAGVDGC